MDKALNESFSSVCAVENGGRDGEHGALKVVSITHDEVLNVFLYMKVDTSPDPHQGEAG